MEIVSLSDNGQATLLEEQITVGVEIFLNVDQESVEMAWQTSQPHI